MHTVTGAFGYSGKYITARLLAKGAEVNTLTNSMHRENPFGGKVKAYPFYFDDPSRLRETLTGTDVLYNTYWVRFNHRDFTHAVAVHNTIQLFRAAQQAGVKRIVHISITNPSEDSPLEYFRGKAMLEKELIGSGLSYAILRPAVLFGKEDILINNIAWALRTFPFFGIFGDGSYKLQPIYVDDLAKLAVEQGEHSENTIIDAIGPETFTYRELVEIIGWLIGKPRKMISVSPSIGVLIGKIIGFFVQDVMITPEEIHGLMANLLYVDSPPAGKTKLTDWIREHKQDLGKRYANELARRTNRCMQYPGN